MSITLSLSHFYLHLYRDAVAKYLAWRHLPEFPVMKTMNTHPQKLYIVYIFVEKTVI